MKKLILAIVAVTTLLSGCVVLPLPYHERGYRGHDRYYGEPRDRGEWRHY